MYRLIDFSDFDSIQFWNLHLSFMFLVWDLNHINHSILIDHGKSHQRKIPLETVSDVCPSNPLRLVVQELDYDTVQRPSAVTFGPAVVEKRRPRFDLIEFTHRHK